MKIITVILRGGKVSFMLWGTLDGYYWHITPGRKWQARRQAQRVR